MKVYRNIFSHSSSHHLIISSSNHLIISKTEVLDKNMLQPLELFGGLPDGLPLLRHQRQVSKRLLQWLTTVLPVLTTTGRGSDFVYLKNI
jgi:hypothetical protein